MKTYVIDGIEYPSVTEILKVINKPELVEWFKRTNFSEIVEKSEKATNIGDIVHDAIHKLLKGERVEIKIKPEYVSSVQNCVSAFLDWKKKCGVEVVETEKLVVSKKHFYAGTFDFVGKVDGKIVLADWKTSSAIYKEYFVQVAAYKVAYEEMTGQKVDECWVIRFGKNTADFEAKKVEDLDKLFTLFLYAYELWKFFIRGGIRQ
jgi:ATP-dependent exoDNAse (exonuclease V) beta subunit